MDMEERMARLERSNRIYRNLFILAGLALVAVVSYGATEKIPEVIRARKFVVINKAAGEVVKIQPTPFGDGWLKMTSMEGKDLVYMGSDVAGDGTLLLQSKEGERLIYAGAFTEDTGGSFKLFNKTGERAVQLYADEYGNGVVGAYNRKGVGRTLKPGP